MRVENANINIAGTSLNPTKSRHVADAEAIKSILFLGIRTVPQQHESKRKVDIFI